MKNNLCAPPQKPHWIRLTAIGSTRNPHKERSLSLKLRSMTGLRGCARQLCKSSGSCARQPLRKQLPLALSCGKVLTNVGCQITRVVIAPATCRSYASCMGFCALGSLSSGDRGHVSGREQTRLVAELASANLDAIPENAHGNSEKKGKRTTATDRSPTDVRGCEPIGRDARPA